MLRHTQDPLKRDNIFDYRIITFFDSSFQMIRLMSSFVAPYSVLQPQQASLLVWALPVSLAATKGIEFSFSSSGY